MNWTYASHGLVLPGLRWMSCSYTKSSLVCEYYSQFLALSQAPRESQDDATHHQVKVRLPAGAVCDGWGRHPGRGLEAPRGCRLARGKKRKRRGGCELCHTITVKQNRCEPCCGAWLWRSWARDGCRYFYLTVTVVGNVWEYFVGTLHHL